MNRAEIEKHIIIDPGIYRGKPVIRGTRVPVYLVVGMLELGQTPEQIVDDYPELTVEDVRAAADFDAFVQHDSGHLGRSRSA